MTVTPLVRTNFIYGVREVLDTYYGSGNHNSNNNPGTVVDSVVGTRPAPATVAWQTTRSLRQVTTAMPRGKYLNLTQFQSGYYIKFTSAISSADNPTLFLIPLDNSYIAVRANGATGNFELWVSGTLVNSISYSGIFLTNEWYHLGITVKNDGTNGFVSFYLDGFQLLTYSGDTSLQSIGVFFGGSVQFLDAFTESFITSFYIDDTTGEEDNPPPEHDFHFVPVIAIGEYNEWVPNGTVTNLDAVDEDPSDLYGTFIQGQNLGEKQSFVLATIPVGFVDETHVIEEVTATTLTRKHDNVSSNLKLGLRESDANEQYSNDKSLNIEFKEITDTFKRNANNFNWNTSKLTNIEIIVETSGVI